MAVISVLPELDWQLLLHCPIVPDLRAPRLVAGNDAAAESQLLTR